MSKTLVQIVATAQQELGLFPVATTVAAATDDTTQQMLALLNRVGEDVRDLKEDGWTALQAEMVVNVIAPIVATGNTTALSTTVSGISQSVLNVDTTYVVQGSTLPQGARVASNPGDGVSLVLTEEATSTATGTTLTISKDTYPVPADFEAFVHRTQWDRSRRWELRGPESPQSDQWVRSGIVATGPRRRYRQIGRTPNIFRIWPPPTSTDTPATLVSEYRSLYWATSASGAPQNGFSADSDTCVFPDDVMVAGLKFYFWRTKGFNSSDLEADFERYRDRAMARDGSAATLSMSRRRWPIFISPANVVDTGFGNP